MATNTAGSSARTLYTEQIGYIRQSFTAAATTAVVINIGTLPKGAIITSVDVAVGTAFTYGTNNLVDIGFGSTATALAQSASLATTGLVKPALTSNVLMGIPLAADTTIFCTPNITGTASTVGSATIIVTFNAQNDFRPS
jgi:hypothetical protein